ncbi:hypothetical protein CSUI_002725, partial [Cystoisospora suis]
FFSPFFLLSSVSSFSKNLWRITYTLSCFSRMKRGTAVITHIPLDSLVFFPLLSQDCHEGVYVSKRKLP